MAFDPQRHANISPNLSLDEVLQCWSTRSPNCEIRANAFQPWEGRLGTFSDPLQWSLEQECLGQCSATAGGRAPIFLPLRPSHWDFFTLLGQGKKGIPLPFASPGPTLFWGLLIGALMLSFFPWKKKEKIRRRIPYEAQLFDSRIVCTQLSTADSNKNFRMDQLQKCSRT